MEYKPLNIEQGNKALIYFQPQFDNGEPVDPSIVSNLKVETGKNGTFTQVTHSIVGSEIVFTLEANQEIGTYDIRISGTIGGSARKNTRTGIYTRTARSGGVLSCETYHLPWVWVGSSSSELDAALASLNASRAAYDAAKAAYETAKAEADAAAYNAANTLTEEGIKEAVEEAVEGGISVEADLTPVTSRLDSTTYGLQAIKTAVDSIEVDVPEGIAMESNATANKEAIIAAMPSTSGLALETTAQAAKDAADAAKTSADAAKTAAENITIPSDVARVTDLPTDYAKAATIPSVSDIQSGLAKATDIPTDYSKAGSSCESLDDVVDELGNGHHLGDILEELEDSDNGLAHIASGVDSAVEKIGETTDTETASSVFGKLANISQELGKLGTPKSGAEYTTLFGAIEANQGGGGGGGGISADEVANKIMEKAYIPYSIDGITLSDTNVNTVLGVVLNRAKIVRIVDTKTTICPTLFNEGFSELQYIKMTAVSNFTTTSDFRSTKLVELHLPNFVGIISSGTPIYGNQYLQILDIPKCGGKTSNSYGIKDCPNLIDLIIGEMFSSDAYFQEFCPTNAISSSSNSLVKEGEEFANNREKFLYNIREHFAANLHDRSEETTKYTIKFHADVYDIFDDATKLAFTSRGWNVSA